MKEKGYFIYKIAKDLFLFQIIDKIGQGQTS